MRHKSPVNRNIGLCRYGSRVKTLTLFTWTGPGCFTFRLRLLLWWWWRWLLSGWEICRLLIGRFTQSLRAQCPAAKLQPSSATGLHQTGALDYLKTVRIRGKIKDVCCDLGQCSLLFKWTIWRPRGLFEDLFEDTQVASSSQMSTSSLPNHCPPGGQYFCKLSS